MKPILARVSISVLISLVAPFVTFADSIPSVNVPDHCTVQGINAAHTYPATGTYLGICALAAAKEQGIVSSYILDDSFSFGLFLSSLNGVAADPSSQFWDIFENGSESQVGLSDMSLAAGDVLTFQRADFTNGNALVGSTVSFKVSLISAQNAATPVAGGLTLHNPFDVSLALGGYIGSMQQKNGSFGSSLLDDWVAIASASGGAGDIRAHLSAYEVANQPALSSVTDYERHAMALEALGINPYSGTSVDYITPIVKSFDGTQIGDSSLDNDDIFAIFPLLHAGLTAQDDIITKATAYIISKQHTDGSWDGSIDMTAAAVQALSAVRSLPDVPQAVQHALGYLRTQQKDDGGFGNTSSTSWVIQAIVASGGSDDEWGKVGYLVPRYYLAVKQERDGGVEPVSTGSQTRVWATAYAIPAVLGKTWYSLLQSFPKPAATVSTSPDTGTTAGETASTEADATGTPDVATPVPEISPVPAASVVTPEENADSPQAPPLPTPDPAPVESQPAAAGSVPTPDFFGNIWKSIVGFFSSFL